jgi:hypothetical protein
MTVSGLEVTITGTGLPTGEEIESITLSKTECEVSASSEAQITCTLQASWVHGDWTPEIRDLKGLSSLTSDFSNGLVGRETRSKRGESFEISYFRSPVTMNPRSLQGAGDLSL